MFCLCRAFRLDVGAKKIILCRYLSGNELWLYLLTFEVELFYFSCLRYILILVPLHNQYSQKKYYNSWIWTTYWNLLAPFSFSLGIWSKTISFLQLEGTSTSVLELAKAAAHERALLDQTKDLLSTVAAMHVSIIYPTACHS